MQQAVLRSNVVWGNFGAMTVLTTLLIVVNVAVLVGGIAYFGPMMGRAPADSIDDDGKKTVSLFEAIQKTLSSHADNLKSVEEDESGEEPSLEQLRRSNQSTREDLDRDSGELSTVLQKYGNLYRSERNRIESYTQNVKELEQLLQGCPNESIESNGILLQFVSDMVKENRQLQLKVSDCQDQVSELIARSVKSERDARTDALTQLPNRRAWDEKLVALESEGATAIALIDVDDFKLINDGHGHAAGDAMLTLIGTILRNSHEASAYRIGGDEFALLIAAGSEENAADRIRKRVSAAVLQFAGEKLSVSVSIGVACREDGDSLPAVLRRADEALYEAKSRKGDSAESKAEPQLV